MTMRHCKGLKVDVQNIEGDVVLPPEFKTLGTLAKLDILADWQRSLRKHYNTAYRDFLREMNLRRDAAKRVKGSNT